MDKWQPARTSGASSWWWGWKFVAGSPLKQSQRSATMSKHEPSNEESYLYSGRPSNLLKTRFSSLSLEQLYRSSSLQTRRGGLLCFLAPAIIHATLIICQTNAGLLARGVTAIFLGLNLCLLAWIGRSAKAKDCLWSTISHFAWQLFTTQILVQLLFKNTEVTPREGMGWMLLMLYLLFATLPLRLSLCALLALITAATYILAVIGLAKEPANTPIDVIVRSSFSSFLYFFACIQKQMGWELTIENALLVF